jgi:hypothetical protein
LKLADYNLCNCFTLFFVDGAGETAVPRMPWVGIGEHHPKILHTLEAPAPNAHHLQRVFLVKVCNDSI